MATLLVLAFVLHAQRRWHIRPCKTRAPREGDAVAALAPPGARVEDASTRQSVARSLQFASEIRTCVPCSSTPRATPSAPLTSRARTGLGAREVSGAEGVA